jgi:hypothetical protein
MTQKSERPLGGSGRCGNQSLWGIIERPLYTADGAHPQEVERHRRAWLQRLHGLAPTRADLVAVLAWGAP